MYVCAYWFQYAVHTARSSNCNVKCKYQGTTTVWAKVLGNTFFGENKSLNCNYWGRDLELAILVQGLHRCFISSLTELLHLANEKPIRHILGLSSSSSTSTLSTLLSPRQDLCPIFCLQILSNILNHYTVLCACGGEDVNGSEEQPDYRGLCLQRSSYLSLMHYAPVDTTLVCVMFR